MVIKMREDYEEIRYYTEGNTVRQMEAMPDETDYREQRRRRLEQEQQAEARRQKRLARQAQEKAMHNSRQYLVLLIAGVLVFGYFIGTYIRIQSDITTRMKTIAKLETQISNLRMENDEAYKRISMAIDLEVVKNIAINELGMFYATPDQIVYYTVENDDYMNQYIEIPEE